jgi:hypothetical protein
VDERRETDVSKAISALVMNSLMMRAEMHLETSVYSPFHHITQLLAREYFTEFSRREGFK